MTALPPLFSGAVQETNDAEIVLDDAVTAVGASGATAGTTASDEAEATEVPDTFEAVTLNV